ncbi:histamine H2 receptor-like [Mercenaria mercenaria]|uniref:histamine H2 receptor-like n=1 Tax=Mercenaria mercenaria TaxID=6596 RepID=UPI001E1D686B|nr:histamine H2 receptor-like [Mercenaria mercenaria]
MFHFKNESCDKMLFYGLPSKDYDIIWNIVDGVMFLPTVFGNTLILISIVRFRRLRTKIHILIGHLAANDLLVGATLLPLESIGDSSHYNYEKYFCLTKLSAFSLTLGGSCMGLFLISVERFSAVAFPLRHAHFTKRKLAVAISIGWLYVMFWTLSPMFGCNNLNADSNNVQCNASIVWGGWCKFGMNLNFILGLCLNAIFYVCVVVIAIKKVKEHGRQTGTSTNLFRSREMSKTVTMAAVLGLFALFWSPYAAITIIITAESYCDAKLYYIRRWFLLLGLFNCSINWMIYGLKNKDFKEAFKTIICISMCVQRRRRRRIACNVIQMERREIQC